MKIHWGTLAVGAVVGGGVAFVLAAKGIVAVLPGLEQNAYALGQANPTLAFSDMVKNPQLNSQLSASPPLVSPPPASATVATAAQQAAQAVQQSLGGAGGYSAGSGIVTSRPNYAVGAFGNFLQRV